MSIDQSTTPVQYREIPGFPFYRVGSDGTVWSRFRKSGILSEIPGEFFPLKIGRVRRGYPRIEVRVDGKPTKLVVHRLVLEAFVGSRPEGMACCHWDGDRNNNKLSNLRWGTYSENSADMIRHGRIARGEKAVFAKLVEPDICEIRRLAEAGRRYSWISRQFGVAKSTVGDIVTRLTWKHIA